MTEPVPFNKLRAEQRARMMALLIELDTARIDGQPWIEYNGAHNAKTYYALTTRGLAESRSGDDYKTYYSITEKGTQAILDDGNDTPEPTPRRKLAIKPAPSKDAAPAHPWRSNYPPQPDEPVAIRMHVESVDTNCDDDCESCVYKQALQLAATKYPALTKLVDALEALQ